MRRARFVFNLGLIVTLLQLGVVESRPVGAQTSLPDVDGTTYTSPTYGFTMTWKDIWHVEEASSSEGVDNLRLNNGYTVMEIRAYRDGRGLAGRCAEQAAAQRGLVPTGPEFFDGTGYEVAIVGPPYVAGFAMVATAYIVCWTLIPGEAVLQVVATFPSGELSNEFPAIEAVINSFDMPDAASSVPPPSNTGSGSSQSSDVNTGAPSSGPSLPAGQADNALPATGDQAAAPPPTSGSGTSYTSPTYGFTVSWDASWRTDGQGTENGVDYLYLSNGTSFVGFFGTPEFAGDVMFCLDSLESRFGSDQTHRGFEPAVAENGAAMESIAENRAWRAFISTVNAPGRGDFELITILDCGSLVPGQATLIITFETPADAFNAEAPKVNALVSGIRLPAAPGSQQPAAGVQDTSVAVDSRAQVTTGATYPCPPDERLIDQWMKNAESARETAMRITDPYDRAPFLTQADQWEQMAAEWNLACTMQSTTLAATG